ncbi:tetratricopeptide repeat protein [Haloferax sp. YSMS24]|uniref:tetratricopeptide repeat protein n=1 Tax=Haloferax sp. YSMS24 TaxID=3388425 RepID=UPI00398C84D4
MLAESVAASFIASSIADILKGSGREVYSQIKNGSGNRLAREFSDILSSELKQHLHSAGVICSDQDLEVISKTINETSIEDVYRDPQDLLVILSSDLHRHLSQQEITEQEIEDIVHKSYEQATEEFISKISGTDIAEELIIELNSIQSIQLQELKAELEVLARSSDPTNWFTRYDVSEQESGHTHIGAIDSGLPSNDVPPIARQELPDEIEQNDYLIIGRKGLGKSHSLAELQKKILDQKDINEVIIPNQAFQQSRDINSLLNLDFQGDVLFIWDDIDQISAGNSEEVIRNSLLKLREKLNQRGHRLFTLLSVRSEHIDMFGRVDRVDDVFWGSFEKITLEPLNEKQIETLLSRHIQESDLELLESTFWQLKEKVGYSDPSPLYIESLVSVLDARENVDLKTISDISDSLDDIWTSQFSQLLSERPTARFVLWGMSLLQMGAIPSYKPLLRRVFSDIFDQSEFDFDQEVSYLLKKQWIRERPPSENPYNTPTFEIHDVQMDAVSDPRIHVVEQFSEFLLNQLAGLVPEGDEDWLPHYHSNTAMFFMMDIIGETNYLSKRHLERAEELSPYNPTIQFNFANYLRMNGELESSLNKLETALAIAPEWAEARDAYAIVLEMLGRVTEAEEQYLKIIRSDRLYPEAHSHLGEMYLSNNQLEGARRQFEAALSGGYLGEEVFVNLGQVLSRIGELREAIEVFERGLEFHPDNEFLSVNLAQEYRNLSYPKKARSCLEHIFEKEDPELLGEAHAVYALSSADIGDEEAAVTHFEASTAANNGEQIIEEGFIDESNIEHSISDFSGEPDSYREGKYLSDQSNFLKAKSAFRDAIEEGYRSTDLYLRLAEAEKQLQNLEAAEEAYQSAIHNSPGQSRPRHHFGNFLKHNGRFKEAEKQFKKACEEGDDIDAAIDFALLYFEWRRFDKAEEQFENAIKIADATDVDSYSEKKLYLNYCNMLRIRERNDEAIAFIEKALEIEPTYAKARFTYGKLLFEENRIEEAAEELGTATKQLIENGELSLWRLALLDTIDAYEEIGEIDSAIEWCDYGISLLTARSENNTVGISILNTRKEMLTQDE